jgi:hypothetical protein
MPDETKLLPCPFCGWGKPRTTKSSSSSGDRLYIKIGCPWCCFDLNTESDEAVAVAKWNWRETTSEEALKESRAEGYDAGYNYGKLSSDPLAEPEFFVSPPSTPQPVCQTCSAGIPISENAFADQKWSLRMYNQGHDDAINKALTFVRSAYTAPYKSNEEIYAGMEALKCSHSAEKSASESESDPTSSSKS